MLKPKFKVTLSPFDGRLSVISAMGFPAFAGTRYPPAETRLPFGDLPGLGPFRLRKG
jgi:hypothetical protein